MRTTGSLEPYTDLKVKSRIDANLMPGPSIDATAPYLEGAPTRFAQMHELTGPDDAKRMVDYWAAEGMTSYKAYMNITREELGVAIQQAHAHKLKLTGHLCSVTWPEAVALGIDDLEHTGVPITATTLSKGWSPSCFQNPQRQSDALHEPCWPCSVQCLSRQLPKEDDIPTISATLGGDSRDPTPNLFPRVRRILVQSFRIRPPGVVKILGEVIGAKTESGLFDLGAE
jgi:hypothetical protein